MMGFMSSSFFLSLYFQDVWHLSALMVAVHLLPMAINGIVVNTFAGWALHRISNKTLMYVASISFAVGFLLFAVSTGHDAYWKFFFPGLLLIVVGADLAFNVANMYVMSSMLPEQQSTAGGIFQTVSKLCTTIGMGMATAVFNSVQARPTLSRYWTEEEQPYAAVFFAGFACAAVSVLMVPFLTIGTQGGRERHREKNVRDEKTGEKTSPEGAQEATPIPTIAT
jgi:MFS family permease